MPSDDITRLIKELVAALHVDHNRDVVLAILTNAALLASQDSNRLNLKITSAVLKEMAEAFKIFQPYNDARKITIFGSARVTNGDPLYAQTLQLAERMAKAGWMVITGAGPGIMAAGTEGAGREMSFGVNIRLPAEQSVNQFIESDPKLVEMKYFFTRKLMFMKESNGFVALPGGFGTQDEVYELFTLSQTGKGEPAPIVLLDVQQDNYWKNWEKFFLDNIVSRGFASKDDCDFYKITDSVELAVREILGFYRNYHSRRWVGHTMIIRLKHAPTNDQLAEINRRFADICVEGKIDYSDPTEAEKKDNDHLDLGRIALRFNPTCYGRLRQLINTLNDCVDE
ncbi:MAG: TIGR00730 family Rossman fold protein [Actinobacteria bacterium]|nr:TIGR00730 family Rossman fold protein [Actinomycetota bacterium]MCL6105730.1 TIGR00730 family Rossman fold protein [Actinomycetota bacterium]